MMEKVDTFKELHKAMYEHISERAFDEIVLPVTGNYNVRRFSEVFKKELEEAGLAKKMDLNSGIFETNLLAELQQFVENNPLFHIITMIDFDDGKIGWVNRATVANRINYMLAYGNKDENLSYRW